MKDDGKPYPGELLKNNLFHDYPSVDSFKRLSSGLKACIDNSARLISDTKVLVENNRYSSAQFLLTTAKEELSKVLILADLCKLDIKKHDSETKKLCRAFYNHVSKHAYYEIATYPRKCLSMTDLDDIWQIETKKYWSSEFESGEPDMPHATYFDRESPLYVDYSDFDNNWVVPNDEFQKINFEGVVQISFGTSDFKECEELIKTYEEEMHNGLLEPNVLMFINENIKKHYINKNFEIKKLNKIFDEIGALAFAKLHISKEEFISAKIHCRFPLYSFV